jgi:hypothetical protein
MKRVRFGGVRKVIDLVDSDECYIYENEEKDTNMVNEGESRGRSKRCNLRRVTRGKARPSLWM